MKRGILLISLALMFGIVALRVPLVCAVPFDFYSITNNTPGDPAIGEAQLYVDVELLAESEVRFIFYNDGPEDCSITQIYFDGFYGGNLYGWWYGSGDVDFAAATPNNPIDPPDLPGGNTIGFEAEFALGAVPPVAPNGVGPEEYLEVHFSSFPETTLFADLLDNLETGETRIGIHVQGFDSEGSESFITSEPIPEPATMLLMGCGLLGLGVFGRKKFLKRA
jgi:hypothetical protein